MTARDPVAELHRARQTHRDALDALDLPAHAKTSLTAAAEALAKARCIVAVRQFIDARTLSARGVAPN